MKQRKLVFTWDDDDDDDAAEAEAEKKTIETK